MVIPVGKRLIRQCLTLLSLIVSQVGIRRGTKEAGCVVVSDMLLVKWVVKGKNKLNAVQRTAVKIQK